MDMCCKWLIIAEIILCVIAAIIAVVVVLLFNTNRKGVAHNANDAAKSEIKETRRGFLKVAKEFLTNNWFLFFLLVILLGFDIYSRISFVCITNESIVLVFVGILATFVVVSNYAQVKDIRDEMAREIKSLEDIIERQNRAQNDIIESIATDKLQLTPSEIAKVKDEVRKILEKEKEPIAVINICEQIYIPNEVEGRCTKYIANTRIKTVIEQMIKDKELKVAKYDKDFDYLTIQAGNCVC